jgi:hypothetical protein
MDLVRRRTVLLPLLLFAIALAGGSHASWGQEAGAGMPTEPKRATQDFVNLLATGAYEEAYGHFDKRMARLYSPSKLETQWKTLLSQAGPFEDLGSPSDTLYKGSHIVDLTARFEWRRVIIRIVWDSTGAVSGMRFLAARLKVDTPPSNGPASEAEISLHAASSPGTDSQTPTATLSLPPIHGEKIPAVILVSKRGRGTLGEIAKALTARGIGVFRWEQEIDPGEWATECIPAVRYLQNRVEVDRARIFLILESSDEAKGETKSGDLAGVRTYPDIRIGGDETIRLAQWILAGNPPVK